MIESNVFDAVVAAETKRLNSVQAGQMSAMYGLSSLKAESAVAITKHLHPVLTGTFSGFPLPSKEGMKALAMASFEKGISLSFLAFGKDLVGKSNLIKETAKALTEVYEDEFDIHVPVECVEKEIYRISGLV